MKKKNTIIAGIIVGVLIVLAVAGIIFTSNKKDQSQDDKPINTPTTEMDTNQEKEPDDNKEEAEDVKDELDETKVVTVWTTANVNFRKTPDINGEVIKVLSEGIEIKKYDEENGWAQVKCGEDVGFVSTEYLTDEEPKEEPEQEPEKPEEQPTASTKVEAIPGQHRDPNSAVVVIDPGHQLNGDSTKEPNGPGSSTMKARVTSGTTGVASGVAEYILCLDIGLKLKAELENRGYTVYMTRSTHDINISNKERAEYATTVGADIAVRIHANGAANASANGAETLAPSTSNPYVGHLAGASQSLSKCILNAYCSATGFKNRGVIASDTMTGINWSTVPVTIIELGFMSNSEEDIKMQNADIQNNMVQGIANGIDAYFGF